ncbi:large ribosomal subunit protein uL11m [Neocloeon triangulifer]|uniref:large ribosomal subunit protein uL11m n=1 Tax=Neocloeon triangulifer TaxID=2078957 RepID=UPI00286EF7C1|nr:large ribosomal subunit protein uL11m [Neocloeon triangulifer]
MSKVARAVKNVKKVVETVQHKRKMRTNIPAGMAVAGPPLGPQLGQRGINVAAFSKDFNERTKDMREGVPLPCRIWVNDDRSYQLVIHQPTASFFVKQAAGITRAAMKPGVETAGKITLKHVYEIAQIKAKDPPLEFFTMQEICALIIGTARSCGIEVVRDYDPAEYAEFLKEREKVVEQQKQELQEIKEAKMMRTA